ncbi:hypothetical protein HK100_005135, partial [Physocladia obscura]
MNGTEAPLFRPFTHVYCPSPQLSEPMMSSALTQSMQQYPRYRDMNTHLSLFPELNDRQQQQQLLWYRIQTTPAVRAQCEYGCETYFGFIKDRHDALLVVEACVQGRLRCIPVYQYTNYNFRSGS